MTIKLSTFKETTPRLTFASGERRKGAGSDRVEKIRQHIRQGGTLLSALVGTGTHPNDAKWDYLG